MTTLTFDELSSCEASEYYYVRLLKTASKCVTAKNVEIISLNVDRGVDFDTLAIILLDFTGLKVLKLTQNYAYGVCIELNDFLQLLELLDLREFVLNDLQSEFLKGINQDDFFSKLPSNCTYRITYGFDPSNGTTHIHPTKNKYMVFVC